MSTGTRTGTSTGTRTGPAIAPTAGLVLALALIVAAVLAPPLLRWHVHAGNVPPLLADRNLQVGPGTLPAIALAVLAVVLGPRVAERSRWSVLLVGSFAVGVAWVLSLATVDGLVGVSRVLDNRSEYLGPARAVTDVGATVRGFIARIPLTAPGHWPVHVAGHPVGALLLFVLLVRLGLDTGLTAGLACIALAATAPVAVLVCLRALGAEAAARRVAPFLVVGPAAVWIGVTGDAVFGAVAAWGLCCLAGAATARTRWRRAVLAVAAGALLGLGVFLSYGLVLIGLIAVAVLVAARSWRPLPLALGAAVAVAVAFALAGFAWWDAYPVLVRRYWAGIATLRPALYWVWANLAVLAISAGPIVGAAVAAALSRLRLLREHVPDRVVVVLTVAAAAVVLVADLSGLSKSEVERIWLPFVPWLLVGTALLSLRWRRAGLVLGVVVALLVQHLLHTAW